MRRRSRTRQAAALSDAEWKAMGPVWRRGHATARDALEDLASSTGWAYTTVKTLLDRLVKKGALSERREGLAAVYEPLVSEDDARRGAIRGLLDRAFGGAIAPMIAHLVADERLSPAERAEMRRMLASEERGGRDR